MTITRGSISATTMSNSLFYFVIAHMRTVLTQAKHCLPTVKNAFIRGSLQDLDSEGAASRIHWFSETGGHCRRDQSSGGGHLGRHLYRDVLYVGDLQWVIDFLVLYL